MSLERSLFDPVKRIALALYPHRWRFCFATLAFFLVPFVLMAAGYLGWQPAPTRLLWFAAPIVLALVAWSWSAFLLAMWFGPSQRFPSLNNPPRSPVARALWLGARVWSLILLAAFILVPFACLLMWPWAK